MKSPNAGDEEPVQGHMQSAAELAFSGSVALNHGKNLHVVEQRLPEARGEGSTWHMTHGPPLKDGWL